MLLGLAWLSPAPALAKPSKAAQVEQLRRRMLETFRAKDYRATIRITEQLYRLDAKPRYLANIGRCYDLLGEKKRAIGFYLLFLDIEKTPKKRQPVLQRLAALRSRPRPRPPATITPKPRPRRVTTIPRARRYGPKRRRFFAGVDVGVVFHLRGGDTVAGSVKPRPYAQVGLNFGYEVVPSIGLSTRLQLDLGLVRRVHSCTFGFCTTSSQQIYVFEINSGWAFSLSPFRFPLFLIPDLQLGLFVGHDATPATVVEPDPVQIGIVIKPGFALSYVFARHFELRLQPLRLGIYIPFTRAWRDHYHGVLLTLDVSFSLRGRF